MHSDQSDKRRCIRCRIEDTLFAEIEGKYFDKPITITDMNRNGVGLISLRDRRDLTGKCIVLHLMSDSNRSIMRSLSARIVYSCKADQNVDESDDTPIRYGLQFVNLSSLEELLLESITKYYGLPE